MKLSSECPMPAHNSRDLRRGHPQKRGRPHFCRRWLRILPPQAACLQPADNISEPKFQYLILFHAIYSLTSVYLFCRQAQYKILWDSKGMTLEKMTSTASLLKQGLLAVMECEGKVIDREIKGLNKN